PVPSITRNLPRKREFAGRLRLARQLVPLGVPARLVPGTKASIVIKLTPRDHVGPKVDSLWIQRANVIGKKDPRSDDRWTTLGALRGHMPKPAGASGADTSHRVRWAHRKLGRQI